MGTPTSIETNQETNEILNGLARGLGYKPEEKTYGPVFQLMFPIMMKDWEELERDEFMSRYGTLALMANLDPEIVIDYVLSIVETK